MQAHMIQEEKSKQGLRILIIDDFHVIVKRLRQTLSSIKNLESISSTDCFDYARHLIGVGDVNTLIMDIHLKMCEPRKGIAFLKEMKEAFPDLMIIVFTNHTEVQYRQLCLSNGADGFLDKAFEGDLIESTVSKRRSVVNNY